jgi:hypothetical protein
MWANESGQLLATILVWRFEKELEESFVATLVEVLAE